MPPSRRARRRPRASPAGLTSFDPATLAIRVACAGTVDRATLERLEALLLAHPNAGDLRFAVACLLDDLGRTAAAARAYARILAAEPAHAGALANAAALALLAGRHSEAKALYERALALDGQDADAIANVGTACFAAGEHANARGAYERALQIDPEHAVAHYALAQLDAPIDETAARAHQQRAFARPIVHVTPAQSADPLRVLVPYASDGGNLVTTLLFDRREVATIALAAESFDGTLPEHDLVFNAVADAERSRAALIAVDRLVAHSGRPCINAPAQIASSGRYEMAVRLGALPGVRVPRIVPFPRSDVSRSALEEAGFTYPLLLRSPGFHAGAHFVRVETADELAPQLATLPGDDVFAMTFISTRDRDGRYAKYRALVIDGALYPLHLAISRHWNVHYFSSENAVHAASRERERAWLAEPREHLGAARMTALEITARALQLDYGGIDFALHDDGIIVFEANASFAIYLPDADATAAYREPAVERAIAAVHAMTRRRGSSAVRELG